jgi:hypothetical protein
MKPLLVILAFGSASGTVDHSSINEAS